MHSFDKYFVTQPRLFYVFNNHSLTQTEKLLKRVRDRLSENPLTRTDYHMPCHILASRNEAVMKTRLNPR